MIEIPEAAVLARQLNGTVQSKAILSAQAAHRPALCYREAAARAESARDGKAIIIAARTT